jgi:hypothetical protein
MNNGRRLEDCATLRELSIRHELSMRIAEKHCKQALLKGRQIELQSKFAFHCARINRAQSSAA